MKQCGLQFDNSYLNLPDIFYTHLEPLPVTEPELLILNDKLAHSLGLDFSKMSEKEQAAMFSGNRVPKGAEPFSQAYAGHQFGGFTMLGDGRAHVLGEHVTSDGERFDIQFKGSGRTIYSRQGDGRAALGPMLREYIISEAMYALGIPTTRALAVVKTGEEVIRETSLAGSILTRIASSHIRVGTFEFAAAQGDNELTRKLLDYTIERHDPDLKEHKNKALAFLLRVMDRQVDLIVHWMRVGFIHGVMNTDNILLSGETIDYGPCAFMDAYDPNTVYSSIDHMGRYAYTNQPVMAQWNIARLAETLLNQIDEDRDRAVQLAEETVQSFSELYKKKWLTMMRGKLGIFGTQENDEELILDLLDWMHSSQADYTNTFRDLSQTSIPQTRIYESASFIKWYERWKERLEKNSKPFKESLQLMQTSNPAVIPRNHKVEQALVATNEGDLKVFRDILDVLKRPYQENEVFKGYQLPPESTERVCQTFCGT